MSDALTDGDEALVFFRGKWRHCRWVASVGRWSLGRGRGFISNAGQPVAPIPPKPEGADGFNDWDE